MKIFGLPDPFKNRSKLFDWSIRHQLELSPFAQSKCQQSAVKEKLRAFNADGLYFVYYTLLWKLKSGSNESVAFEELYKM